MKLGRWVSILALALWAWGAAPAAYAAGGVDQLYEQARTLAFGGEREQARALCAQILERSPNYIDARVLLGRLYAWDKDYDMAREVLATALRQRPDYTDARLALIDVELWSDRAEVALQLAEEGLARDPGNAELSYRKTQALKKLGRTADAMAAAEATLAVAPDHKPTARLYHGLLDETLQNKVSLDYELEDFNDSTKTWHQISAAYRRSGEAGSVTARLNVAHRFSENGAQFEIDAYPKLWHKTYAYLNFGYSDSKLFPEFRYGAELYHNFPGGWEASAGFRRLEFSSTDVTIFTGTIARYIGNYWISLRPNYVDSTDDSVSGQLSVRRFFGSRYEYAELTIGGGLKNKADVVTLEEDQLDSFRIKGELRRRIAHRTVLKGSVGYRSQDLAATRTRKSYILRFGVEQYF